MELSNDVINDYEIAKLLEENYNTEPVNNNDNHNFFDYDLNDLDNSNYNNGFIPIGTPISIGEESLESVISRSIEQYGNQINQSSNNVNANPDSNSNSNSDSTTNPKNNDCDCSNANANFDSIPDNNSDSDSNTNSNSTTNDINPNLNLNIDFKALESTLSSLNDNDNKDDNKIFVDNLWDIAEEEIAPLVVSHCAIYINAHIDDKLIPCLIDTGATTNVIFDDIVKNFGLESYVDTQEEGVARGVGSCKIVGKIPYIEMKIGDISVGLNFSVLQRSNNTANDYILLGLPFILFYKLKLDFEKKKIYMMNHEIDMIVVDG